ncbi:hypothetical protein EM868_15350 [Cupriavidus gilardii]|uniref:hypothetical protein n=1 Tax=Cupriavidus gilardii TaxID=82541 RepID=UPI001EE6136A|nr:hypothetical protein [Cupriavidus gilardii]MCG5262360.1 hypothetical protein [Cupriavidus gilardii]MDF9431164.1 hypothetical protein [Cupriavidus gilardii]
MRSYNKKFALNTSQPIAQYHIADNWTLQSVLGGTRFREEWEFIRFLADRSPFSAGLPDVLQEEIGGAECRTRPGGVLSNALTWATLLGSATVSFDAHHDWSQAWVATTFSSLEHDDSVLETEEHVRNASQPEHADEHADWLKLLGFFEAPDALQVWSEREVRYPGLRFLPRVRGDLVALQDTGAAYIQALAALRDLSGDAISWDRGNAWPKFSRRASPESARRQGLCKAKDDGTGRNELFDWHTRFTGGLAGRLHFRVDVANHVIVVAYIGRKLMDQIPG